MDWQKNVFMTVPFLYYDKQVAVYHGNFFGGNDLWISGIYVIYTLRFWEEYKLRFFLMVFGRY